MPTNSGSAENTYRSNSISAMRLEQRNGLLSSSMIKRDNSGIKDVNR